MVGAMNNKPKMIMAVANDYAFDGRVQRTIEALKQAYEITLISFKSEKKVPIKDFYLKEVLSYKFKEYKGIKSLAKPFFHIYFWLIIIMTVLKKRPLIFYGHDFFMALPGFVIASLTKTYFIYDAHEYIIPTEKHKQGLEERIWYFFEKIAIKKAKLVITVNEEKAKLMKDHYQLAELPIYFRNISPVENGCPTNISNVNIPFSKRESDILIIYQGVMDKSRGLLDFIDAMEFLDDKYVLILIGYGKDYDFFKEYINLKHLEDKIHALEKVSRKELPNIIKKCDIGIIAYGGKSVSLEYCEPNKLYDYAQNNLPVICTDQINLKNIMQKYKIGVTIDFDTNLQRYNPYDIAKGIKNIAQNIDFYKQNIPNFLEDYNWETEKNRLFEAVKRITNNKN